MSKRKKAVRGSKTDAPAGETVQAGKKQERQAPETALSKEPKRHAKPDKKPKGSMDDEAMLLISKALADPRRLLILRTIAKGATSSCAEVQQHLPISAATLSHHMRELEMAGLIETVRDGRFRQARLQRKVLKNYLGELKAMMD